MCSSEGALKINLTSFPHLLSVYWCVLGFSPAGLAKNIDVCVCQGRRLLVRD